MAILHALDAVRSNAGRSIIKGAFLLMAAVILQATLGILTLLNQVPTDLALAHQAVAIAVLTLAVLQAERLVRRPGHAPQKIVQPATQTG
jgi:heme a synthase